MHVVSSAQTSADAWERIQTSFANKSATRLLSLREKLSHLKRETRSVSEYLQIVKNVSEDLALAGSPVSPVDLVIHVLNGIGSDFKEIAAAVRARDSIISFEELKDKLLSHELYLKRSEASLD